MSYEIFMYAGWPCAIAAGVVAAANFHALRVERARSHNLFRRVRTCCDGLVKIRDRATPKAKGAELAMEATARTTLRAQIEIANEGDA